MLFAHCAFYKEPCPKCGLVMGSSLPRTIINSIEEVMLPRTHSTEYCTIACDQIRQLLDKTKNKNRKHYPEHLHKHCLSCGWEWLECTKDSDDQLSQLTKGVQ